MKKLKAYMGYDNTVGSGEGAILIFAHTAREAKTISYGVTSITDGCDYIDYRVKLLKNPWLLTLSKKDTPHIIESPETCKLCGYWGDELVNGVCKESCTI